MLNKISFQEFLDLTDATYNNYSFEWRYGQTIMNVLSKVWPSKYNELVATDKDCFYDDGFVKTVLEKLEKEWVVDEY